jgi:hypothetical protein
MHDYVGELCCCKLDFSICFVCQYERERVNIRWNIVFHLGRMISNTASSLRKQKILQHGTSSKG